MKDFSRKGPVIRIRLGGIEATVLESLLDELRELMDVDEPPADNADPFARWQAEFSETALLDDSNPAIRMMFTPAYPDDPVADAEFQRFTQARRRRQRIDQAELVMAALRESGRGERPVQVRVVEVDEWLKVLGALRLMLAARLGIERAEDADELDALPEDDPRSLLNDIYLWIANLSEGLLSVL